MKVIKTYINLKPDDIDFEKIDAEDDYSKIFFSSLQKNRDGFIFSRYCNFAPYNLLLKNRIDKALEKYEKVNSKNKLLEYEKCLINYINSLENYEFNAFDSSCDTSIYSKFENPLSFIKAFIIVFLISSVFFCGFCGIYNLILSLNSLIYLSAPWYIGFLCSALCSIFGACAFFSYMPNKKLSKTERKNFSNILISKGLKRFTFIVFILSIAVSIFFALMIMTSNVRFNEKNIKFENKSYSYNHIDSIYHIDARYNVYYERIERSSYVILFKDKTSLDLDGYTSAEITEKQVIPFLKSKGFEIKKADSERELPWYTE